MPQNTLQTVGRVVIAMNSLLSQDTQRPEGESERAAHMIYQHNGVTRPAQQIHTSYIQPVPRDGICVICRVDYTSRQYDLLASACDHDICKSCYMAFFRRGEKQCGACPALLHKDSFTENVPGPSNNDNRRNSFQNLQANQPQSTHPNHGFALQTCFTFPDMQHRPSQFVQQANYQQQQGGVYHQQSNQYSSYQHQLASGSQIHPHFFSTNSPDPWNSNNDGTADYQTSAGGSNTSQNYLPHERCSIGEETYDPGKRTGQYLPDHQLYRSYTAPPSGSSNSFYDRGRGIDERRN